MATWGRFSNLPCLKHDATLFGQRDRHRFAAVNRLAHLVALRVNFQVRFAGSAPLERQLELHRSAGIDLAQRRELDLCRAG